MSYIQSIEQKLATAFKPSRLEVIDESHRHAGHAHGDHDHFTGEGESHLRIRIVSDAFTGMSRIERHRAINAHLTDEIAAGLHAIAIEAAAPGEPVRG